MKKKRIARDKFCFVGKAKTGLLDCFTRECSLGIPIEGRLAQAGPALVHLAVGAAARLVDTLEQYLGVVAILGDDQAVLLFAGEVRWNRQGIVRLSAPERARLRHRVARRTERMGQ